MNATSFVRASTFGCGTSLLTPTKRERRLRPLLSCFGQRTQKTGHRSKFVRASICGNDWALLTKGVCRKGTRTAARLQPWRTHSCVQRRDSSRRIFVPGAVRRQECRRGTHECVRHGSPTAPPQIPALAPRRLARADLWRWAGWRGSRGCSRGWWAKSATRRVTRAERAWPDDGRRVRSRWLS